ncbi:MAG: hypothetical protein QHH15_06175 [Candidatus Thermoplasmatota archaeon]|jgi:Na+-driven multidrug efflux pump|nr:hypothetical protein [Candidatus Thermoplasmatota archaeon]
MQKNDFDYLKIHYNNLRLIRAEILFTPLLILLPIIVSIFLVINWYFNGFLKGVSDYNVGVVLALIILLCNIVFDIPFIKTLLKYNKK